MKRLCPSPALVVACLALTFAVAGTGYAALKLPKNSVTTVQVKDFSLLRRDFKAGQLPTAGSGVAARWAHVRADGRLLAQSGGVSVNHVDVGHYLVDFGAAVTGKAIVASPSRFGDLDPRGEVLAGPCGGEPEGGVCPTGNDQNHVRVTTYDSGDTARQDQPFYVVVIG